MIGSLLGVKNGYSCRRNGVTPSRLGFSPVPPPIRPIDRNWLSSVNARNMRNARIEMRAGTELDIFLAVLHPVQDRDIGRNAEIAGDVEHPQLASGVGELALQVADVGIVEHVQVDFRPLRSVVPPDRVGIPFHQFEEALDDGFLDRVAGRAAVGIRLEGGRAAVEEIQQAGRKVFEAFVAQRPDRRPLDLGRRIERLRRRLRLVAIRASIPASAGIAHR